MRINDGSICLNCNNFDHDCGNGEGCIEKCESENKDVRENFDESDKPIVKCNDFDRAQF